MDPQKLKTFQKYHDEERETKQNKTTNQPKPLMQPEESLAFQEKIPHSFDKQSDHFARQSRTERSMAGTLRGALIYLFPLPFI